MNRTEQIKDFLAQAGWADANLHPLAGDASFRRYIRIHREHDKAMLMDAPPEREDVRPYLAVADFLFARGYSVPNILARDAKSGLLLLEDLGDDTFSAELKSRDGDERIQRERILYEAAIDLLAQWHGGLADPGALPLPLYDEALLMREVALFADWFLPQVLGRDAAKKLRDEYMALWHEIITGAELETTQFIHRDYHADNLMWLPERKGAKRVGLLDFQDGVYGDAAYDLVSLLEDARRDVAPELAAEMLTHYVRATACDEKSFRMRYDILGAQRNSKIIGIFARLAARDGKEAYLHFLPRVWKHLERDVRHPKLAALKTWLDRHIAADKRGVITIAHNAHDLQLSA